MFGCGSRRGAGLDALRALRGDHAREQLAVLVVGLDDQYSLDASMIGPARRISGVPGGMSGV